MTSLSSLFKTGDSGKWIHFGATSYDIVDTARALQHKKAVALLEIAIDKLIDALAHLANEHKKTVMLGRTHGQWATPITFGLKMAVFTSELKVIVVTAAVWVLPPLPSLGAGHGAPYDLITK
mgnify:CR=1 FL=1